MLGCFKGFLEFDDCSWVEFAANNIVGFLALSWAVGISFMLTVTLTVLQLREVLHPDILARIIRPQEAHSELLKSLKTESTITHARRTCISMLVYLLILLFYVYFPIQVCRLLGGSMFPLKIKLWYFLPEIQLPVELSLAHIAFLTILEKKKDIIGQIEHIWFKRAAELLHFERFVLPYMAVTAAAAGVDQGETVEAMVRPAPNWDAHNGEANVVTPSLILPTHL